jgi:hypothetical protein
VREVPVETDRDPGARDQVEGYGDRDVGPAEQTQAPGQRNRGEEGEEGDAGEDPDEDSLEDAVRLRVHVRA